MIEDEIFGMQEDLRHQEIFVTTIIAMINQIGIAKRDNSIVDLEVGFRLGEIYRMLHEFNADSMRLRKQIQQLFDKVISESKGNKDGQHKILFD